MKRRNFFTTLLAGLAAPLVPDPSRREEPRRGSRGYHHVTDDQPARFSPADYVGEFRWINLEEATAKAWRDRYRVAYSEMTNRVS